jgi:hypothetical protein
MKTSNAQILLQAKHQTQHPQAIITPPMQTANTLDNDPSSFAKAARILAGKMTMRKNPSKWQETASTKCLPCMICSQILVLNTEKPITNSCKLGILLSNQQTLPQIHIEKYQNKRSLAGNNKLIGPVINKAFLGLTREVGFITEAFTKQTITSSGEEIYIFNFALYDYQSAIEDCQKDNREEATVAPNDQQSKVDSKALVNYKIETWTQVSRC